MANSRIMKPLIKFLDDNNIELRLTEFIKKEFPFDDNKAAEDLLKEFDDEELEAFAKVKEHLEKVDKSIIIRDYSKEMLDSFIEAFNKAYKKKISGFFNEFFLVSLSFIVPTIVQLLYIDKVSIVSAVWLTVPFTFLSILKDSNILEFLKVEHRYKKIIFVDYFQLAKDKRSQRRIFTVLSFPFQIVKSILLGLHSFVAQFWKQLAIYFILLILALGGYHQIRMLFVEKATTNHQIVTQSTSNIVNETKESDVGSKILTVDKIGAEKSSENPEIAPQSFSGQLTEANKYQEFHYTPSTTGGYRLEFVGLKEGIDIPVTIKDSSNKTIDSFVSGGASFNLEANQEYTISVSRRNTDTSFELQLSIPKPVFEVSDYTSIEDSFAYTDEVNRYEFVADEEGVYTFEITDAKEGIGMSMKLLDHLNKVIESTSSKTLTLSLKQGETYQLQVSHNGYDELGKYQLKVDRPKKKVDISGYTAVKDSVEYPGQTNQYTFIADVSGTYGFELANKMADANIDVFVLDKNDKKLLDLSFSDQGTVALEKGETYSIHVIQDKDFSDYTLKIGYAKPIVDISKNRVGNGRMTFKNQVIAYQYKPNQTGNFSIKTSGNVSIRVKDEYGEELSSFSDTVSLEKDKVYTIEVVQNGDLGKYRFEINYKNKS